MYVCFCVYILRRTTITSCSKQHTFTLRLSWAERRALQEEKRRKEEGDRGKVVSASASSGTRYVAQSTPIGLCLFV